VLYALADDEINTQVVIDSTSAPNYDAWQTNAHGTGADVSIRFQFPYPSRYNLTRTVVLCSLSQHIQIKYNLYYFEVQNMEEAISGGRPKLMQVGPYAYKEYYVKFDITWTDDGDTVTYGSQRYYIYDQVHIQLWALRSS
jgi:hypothetical protein